MKLADNSAQAGSWNEAGRYANKIRSSLLSEKEKDRLLFIRSSVSAKENNSDKASSTATGMNTRSTDYIFARFNIMLSMMRNGVNSSDLGAFVRGTPFADVDNVTISDMELISLRDRFLVTAGKYELDNGHYSSAISFFRDVSKAGPYTDEALLHYGWALAKQWQFDQALQPWRALQGSYPVTNLNVLESVMAMAHVVELKNGGYSSIAVYEYSERRLSQSLSQISKLKEKETIEGWIDGWADQNYSSNWWVANGRLIPESPSAIALEQLLNTTLFDKERQKMMEATSMGRWVKEKYERLGGIQEKLLKQAASAERRIESTRNEIEKLKRQLKSAVKSNGTGKDDLVAAFLEESNEKEINSELDEELWYLNELINYYESLPEKFGRLNEIKVDLNAVSIRIVNLKEQQRAALINLVEDHLSEIEVRLNGYLANTRLAIARLYDRKFRNNGAVEGVYDE